MMFIMCHYVTHTVDYPQARAWYLPPRQYREVGQPHRRDRGSGSTVGCCFGLSVLYFWGEAEQRQEERKGGQEIEDGGKRRNRRGRDPSGVASVSPV